MTEYIEHITSDGDRWDLLAWRYYGDALRYEPIIAANPGLPILPILPGGARVFIPVLDKNTVRAGEELPPWLR